MTCYQFVAIQITESLPRLLNTAAEFFSFLLQFLLFVSRSKELSATSFNNLQVLIPLTSSQSLPVLGVISMLHISKKSLFGD